MLDGIKSRYSNATIGIPDELLDYQICETAMSMNQVYYHIYQLSFWVGSTFQVDLPKFKKEDSLSAYRTSTLALYDHIRNGLIDMTEEQLRSSVLYLKRTDTYLPFWYIINGPMSDILTHIGQINSWRRAAGHPCPSYSPLLGKS